jgi:hypothetical protein
MTTESRDVLSPREVADRAGFSYHAILRAIRRGDLQAFEPVPGHYRIELVDYERWLRRPVRIPSPPPERAPRARTPTPNRGPVASRKLCSLDGDRREWLMDLRRKQNGEWELRWQEGGRKRSRSPRATSTSSPGQTTSCRDSASTASAS